MTKRKRSDDGMKWVAIAIVILALALYSTGGINFQAITNLGGTSGGASTPTPSTVDDYDQYSVSFFGDKTSVCQGEYVRISIISNIPNGVCSVFVNPNNAGWQYLTNVQLTSSGQYQTDQQINLPLGTYTGAAVCCDAARNCKLSTTTTLNVISCDDSSDDTDPVPEGGSIPCTSIYNPSETVCSMDGYCSDPQYPICAYRPASIAMPAGCECTPIGGWN